MPILSTLQQTDLRLFAWMFRNGERYLLIPPARAFSRSGDGYLHALVPLLLFSMGESRVGDLVLVLAFALAMERPLYWLLKNSLKRRRPAQFVPGFRSMIVASDQFSFPSGHSSAAFLLVTCLCIVYGAPAAVMLMWATAVSFSRVLLGVHFPGDIVAGAGMGTTVALMVGSMLALV
jgi:undecaprenyl-diphosphatase